MKSTRLIHSNLCSAWILTYLSSSRTSHYSTSTGNFTYSSITSNNGFRTSSFLRISFFSTSIRSCTCISTSSAITFNGFSSRSFTSSRSCSPSSSTSRRWYPPRIDRRSAKSSYFLFISTLDLRHFRTLSKWCRRASFHLAVSGSKRNQHRWYPTGHSVTFFARRNKWYHSSDITLGWWSSGQQLSFFGLTDLSTWFVPLESLRRRIRSRIFFPFVRSALSSAAIFPLPSQRNLDFAAHFRESSITAFTSNDSIRTIKPRSYSTFSAHSITFLVSVCGCSERILLYFDGWSRVRQFLEELQLRSRIFWKWRRRRWRTARSKSFLEIIIRCGKYQYSSINSWVENVRTTGGREAIHQRRETTARCWRYQRFPQVLG